ncbi:MAG: hypothetical protein LBM38_03290 [Clostridiales bacterium]|jgi:2-phosphoglycerate kinase|nr:hypothetical protein [Clostridiales bacterium]
MKSTCVFIYGAPAVGKTSIVNKLQMNSSEYVSVAETDFTRDFLRGFENFPHERNFYESFFDLPPEEYRKQAESMSKNSAGTAVMRTQNGLKDIVFLGAHLIPSVIHQNKFDNINLKEILMVVSDENEHFRRLSTRSNNAHDGADAFNLTRNWQDFLISEAKKFDIPILESDEFLFDNIKKVLPGMFDGIEPKVDKPIPPIQRGR